MSNGHMWAAGVIFTVLPLWEAKVYRGPGVYMFCRRESDGSRTILYIGEAEDIAERFIAHEKVPDGLALGMNELHVHLLAETKRDRLQVETHLRRQYATPLNEQVASMQRLGLMNAFASDRPRNALAPLLPYGGWNAFAR